MEKSAVVAVQSVDESAVIVPSGLIGTKMDMNMDYDSDFGFTSTSIGRNMELQWKWTTTTAVNYWFYVNQDLELLVLR